MTRGLVYVIILLAAFTRQAGAQQIEPVSATQLVSLYGAQQDVVVVNFWSTWCKPCIEEIPHFLQVYDSLKTRGVQLWLISQDTRDLFHSGKLMAYIAKKAGWNRARLFWFNETNADYYCPLISKEWSGVIPATLIVNNKTGYTKFTEESMSAAVLTKAIEEALGN